MKSQLSLTLCLYGLREKKYNWLFKNDINTVKWKKASPISEFYLFQPSNNKLLEHYYSFNKITEIFPVNNVGMVTARDNLTIQFTKEEIYKTVRNFAYLDIELARQTYKLGEDVRDWKVEWAQKDLKDSGVDRDNVVKISYRPFDTRFTYFTGNSRGFHCMPRGDFMKHFRKNNLGILVCRQQNSIGFYHAFIANTLFEACVVSNRTREINYGFPLYVNIEKEPKKKGTFTQIMLFEPEVKYQGRIPNINPEIFEQRKKDYRKEPSPEDIFYYIYAILYSNTYREKYAEFLKIDFPRIPFTKDYRLFIKLSKLGLQLAELHLLKAKELDKQIIRLCEEGSNRVDKVNFVPGGSAKISKKRTKDEPQITGNVYINETQYFEEIPQEVWEYQIGGYQVCEKWLKDRKGRTLTKEEITTYCKIVTALNKTIKIQEEIDELYDEVEE